jgi:hypothetical protein
VVEIGTVPYMSLLLKTEKCIDLVTCHYKCRARSIRFYPMCSDTCVRSHFFHFVVCCFPSLLLQTSINKLQSVLGTFLSNFPATTGITSPVKHVKYNSPLMDTSRRTQHPILPPATESHKADYSEHLTVSLSLTILPSRGTWHAEHNIVRTLQDAFTAVRQVSLLKSRRDGLALWLGRVTRKRVN